MTKAKTYRLWAIQKTGMTKEQAIHSALSVGGWLFDARQQCLDTIVSWTAGQGKPCSFLVRVVPPAKRRAKR